jgi:hypothetical protein
MTNHPDNNRHDRRAKLTAAAVGGILAGVARAGLDWLLQRLASD